LSYHENNKRNLGRAWQYRRRHRERIDITHFVPSAATRDQENHQKTKVLGVTITNDGVLFGCNHCDFKGGKKLGNGNDSGRNYGRARPREVTVAEFPYYDESGKTLFVVERRHYQNSDGSFVLDNGKPKKTHKQKRPDPNKPGRYIWNTQGVRVVPYRLPHVLEAIGHDHPVLIPEGERKVDLLLSWHIAATCNAGGAGKWKPEHSQFLRGADVVLLPDNDNAGWQHIHQVATSLLGIAKRIRVLVLPHTKAKGDIVDWAAAGGTREQLDALIDAAKDWQPPSGEVSEEEKARAKAREDELLDALAKTQGLDYDRQKKVVAKELGVSIGALNTEVKARREDMKAAPLWGHWITPPWPEVCDGDSLLRDIIRRIKRHVIISDDNALAIALWIMMSWVHDEIAVHSPILNINSAEPESGKSTTIMLMAFLMPKCIACVEITEAAIYRAIKKWSPSFCFDEFDDVLRSGDKDKTALRSVINSGHTKGQGVLKCVGDDHTPEFFETFAPKAIGMVGRKLPPATLSRCIFIELHRRKKDEDTDEFNHKDDNELTDLRSRLRRWSMDNQDALQNATPSMPEELHNRRANKVALLMVHRWMQQIDLRKTSKNRLGGAIYFFVSFDWRAAGQI
jgi:hypothetical protein